MEIIKLRDICQIHIGKTPSTKNKLFWNKKQILFLDGSLQNKQRYVTELWVKENNVILADRNDILMTILGNYYFKYVDCKCAYNQQIALLKNVSNFVKNKFLYYSLLKNKDNFKKISIGTTVKHLNKNIISNFKLKILSLEEQQQIIDIIKPKEELFIKYNKLIRIDNINDFKNDWKVLIDIIEPFEKKLNCLSKKLSTINYIYTSMINKKHNANIMKEDGINFVKGISYNKLSIVKECGIPFINVSAINNKINTYVAFEQKKLINVNYGDVILSLDGNPGLVNNFLRGVNGYGYHVKSEKYNNYEIYFSLLNERNQNIISSYSHGTTIKHATKAMNHLLIFDFKNYKNTLKNFFEYEIILKTKISILNKIINNLIELYIKN